MSNKVKPMFDRPWHGPNTLFKFSDDDGRFKKILLLRYSNVCRDAVEEGNEKDIELIKKGPGVYKDDELLGYCLAKYTVVVDEPAPLPEAEKKAFTARLKELNNKYGEDVELDTSDVKEKL